MNSPVYQDAGRSTLFFEPVLLATPPNRKSHSAVPLAKLDTEKAGKQQNTKANLEERRFCRQKKTQYWMAESPVSPAEPDAEGASIMPSPPRGISCSKNLRGNSTVEQQLDDSIHPRFGALRKSWQNFDLFMEYSSGGEDPALLLKNLTERRELLDFAEMLSLLRSIQLLCPRNAIFNPYTQITISAVHEIFLEVNKKERTKFVSSSGFIGQADMDQCTFEEYRLIMLCIAHSLEIPLGNLFEYAVALPEGATQEEIIQEVMTLTHRAHSKGIMQKPGTAQFLERAHKEPGVKVAFKNLQAARLACDREEFNTARAATQFATSVFLQHLRPDLLCEIRLIEDHIAREEKSMLARKGRVQTKVELELQNANTLSRGLKVDEAKAKISQAIKMSEAARLEMKGTLRYYVRESESFLEQAVRAIEGDKKLKLAWRALQRDELKDAREGLKSARAMYAGIQMREAALVGFEEALSKKSEHESTRKLKGRALLEKAMLEIESKNFDAAYETLEEARAHYLIWTIPIGWNQLLTEQTTKMFQMVWEHEELYNSFCAFDLDNLSGAGARALMMDFGELLHLLRSLGVLAERTKEEENSAGDPPQKIAKSRLLALDARQHLIDECSTPDIRKSDTVKIAKAVVYTEFRAVNKLSMNDLAGGNMEADDDMSSLNWGEYQILIMRIAKNLHVPVTDSGCSPLFSKEIERVDAAQTNLDNAKKDYLNGIVAAGECFLMKSRLAVQEKKFTEAIYEVHQAEAEFKRLWDEKILNFQLTNCSRQLEAIEQARIRENYRRADQKAQGDTALNNCSALLADFEATGALFDDQHFASIEKNAVAAQKCFKSAACFSADLKSQIVSVLSQTSESKEAIVRLRQGVSRGNTNLEKARVCIEDLTQKANPGLSRVYSTASRTASIASEKGAVKAVPSASHASPFERPFSMLLEARELFTNAKIESEFQELVAVFEMLHTITVERKIKQTTEALAHVQASQARILDATTAQNTSAEQVELCYDDARKKLLHAKSAFRRAACSDVVLDYRIQHSRFFRMHRRRDLETSDHAAPQIPDVNGTQACEDLEDEIEAEAKAWQTRHEQEVRSFCVNARNWR